MLNETSAVVKWRLTIISLTVELLAMRSELAMWTLWSSSTRKKVLLKTSQPRCLHLYCPKVCCRLHSPGVCTCIIPRYIEDFTAPRYVWRLHSPGVCTCITPRYVDDFTAQVFEPVLPQGRFKTSQPRCLHLYYPKVCWRLHSLGVCTCIKFQDRPNTSQLVLLQSYPEEVSLNWG